MKAIAKATRRTILGLAAGVLLLGGGYLVADCNSYSNSRIIYVGYDAYCGDTGSGCTECTDSGGGSCVTDGAFCKPQQEHQNP